MAKEALRRVINVTQLTDAEIRQVTRNAAREADRIMRSLEGVTGPGADVRRAQVALAKMNTEMWKSIGDATRVGIGDAFDSATEMQALLDSKLMSAVGIGNGYWEQSMLATAREGIDSYIGRRENGYTLSERVYRNTAMSKGYVDRAINNGLLLGKSAREIAKDVVGFIDPNVPGGASYAAMRLARTEVSNAFHRTSINKYKETPWVERVKWTLSGSHPKRDECNEYAEEVHTRGLGAGEFLPGDVPEKPHPQCLCTIEPIVMDLDAYVKAFHEGKFDNYIDKQMGCAVSA